MRKTVGISLVAVALLLSLFQSLALSIEPVPTVPSLPETESFAPEPSAIVIPLTGEVDKVMAFGVRRQFKTIDSSVSVVVLEIDATGGQIEYALKIMERIERLPRKTKVVAFLRGRATGYALLIAMACDAIVATETSVLGDCPPIAYDAKADAQERSGYQKFLLKKLTRLCEKNGYRFDLVSAMVDRSRRVVQHEARLTVLEPSAKTNVADKELLADGGQLLVLEGKQIEAAGFSETPVAGGERDPVAILRQQLIRLTGQSEVTLHHLPTALLERADATKKVALIDVKGEVDYGMGKYVERAIEQALEQGATTIVFRMSTWGGLVSAGLDIQKMILNVNAETIAYVEDKSISAGALIALACDHLVMRGGSTIGDCEPIYQTGKGIETAPEKIQTVLRERFRTNAKDRNYPKETKYPKLLCEAMVTKQTQVYRLLTNQGVRYVATGESGSATELDLLRELLREAKSQRDTDKSDSEPNNLEKEIDEAFDSQIIVRAGQLPTFTTGEAYRHGFASFVVNDLDAMYKSFQIPKSNVTHIEVSWSEEMVRFLNSGWVVQILFVVGLMALWTEFKVPGFGLPGIVGLTCFAIIFTSKYLVDLASVVEIVLFAIGSLLLILEIFVIPGFGVAGLSGLLMMGVALVMSMQSFTIPSNWWEWREFESNLVSMATSFFVAMLGFFVLARFLPSTPVLRRMILATEQTAQGGYTAAVAEEKTLVGVIGVSITTLRPSGKAEFNGKPYTVMAEGGLIEQGRRVQVLEAEGNRIVVTEV